MDTYKPSGATEASAHPTVQQLGTLLREASRLQAIQYFDDASVTVAQPEADLQLGQVLRRYMSLVILNSRDLRIVLKLHFDLDDMQAYRQSRGATGHDLEPKQVIDYLKELSNQVGGRVCRAFDAQQLPMGMSVPLCTRGIYEIYADYNAKAGAVVKGGEMWRLSGGFGTLYCSCYCELPAGADYSAVTCEDNDADTGELDFL